MIVPGRRRSASAANQKWRAPGSSSLAPSRHEREAEDVAVERGRPLEVGADQRRVVQPGDAHPLRRCGRGAGVRDG